MTIAWNFKDSPSENFKYHGKYSSELNKFFYKFCTIALSITRIAQPIKYSRINSKIIGFYFRSSNALTKKIPICLHLGGCCQMSQDLQLWIYETITRYFNRQLSTH